MESAIKLCDLCQSHPAQEFRIWREEDTHAKVIDLCRDCSRTLLRSGRKVELPTKKRMTMEVTKLKTTRKTAPLKKKKTPAKPKSD